MTATVLLVRHAVSVRHGGVLSGRSEGVHLSDHGHEQARQLADHLAHTPLDAVYASPLARTRETAEPIAARAGLDLRIEPALIEIDFGDWTGRAFSDLNDDPLWRAWNTARAVSRPPNGESMLEAQVRAVEETGSLRRRHAGETVALVSHGDVIKAIVLYHLGLPIDSWMRIEIAPASVSRLAIGDWGARLISLNESVTA